MLKLTPWFCHGVKPVRVGTYEVEVLFSKGRGWFAFWGGEYWSSPETGKRLFYQERRWRGLTKEAK